jgi:hypothetical protein
MKKTLGILALTLLFGAGTFATDVTVNTVPDTLIRFADQAIADGKVSVDKFITVMQTIHQQQKTAVQSALSS